MYKIHYDISIPSFMSSILKYYHLPTSHQSIPRIDQVLQKNQQKTIVLMIFDGMGSNICHYYAKEIPFLLQNKIMDLDSVFPPTTTSATTAFLSGKYPIETGLIGWSMYIEPCHSHIDIFKNVDSLTKKPFPIPCLETFFPYEEIGTTIHKNNEHIAYYTFFPAFKKDGYRSLDELKEALITTCNKNEQQFIYVYWENPDLLLHEKGITNISGVLKEINSFVKDVYENTKDCTFFISADHGQVDVTPICLYTFFDICQCLQMPPSLEGRTTTFFIKDGYKEQFKKLFLQYFGDKFVLFSKKEALEKQLFGIGTPHPQLTSSLGDYISIATQQYYFRFFPNSFIFKGAHAGATKEECQIPLIYLNNTLKNGYNSKDIRSEKDAK